MLLGNFVLNLLTPPSEEYINKLLFHLTFGEQAPCKSLTEAMNLPIKQRDAFVQMISDAYRKQKEEMDRANRKNNPGTRYH